MTFPEDDAQKVYEIFSDTEYGKRLKKAARYNRFRPENYSVKYWGRLLGPDVNNLQHMRHTIAVAHWFVTTENKIKPGAFTYREALLLGMTAALHDQAEAIIGDIPHGRKTGLERLEEHSILRSNESVFEPKLKGITLKLYRIGRDKIAFGNPDKRLPGAFMTIELIGFLENAFHALKQIQYLNKSLTSKKTAFLGISTKEHHKQVITALRRLSTEVLGSGIIEQLIILGDRFPSALTYLRHHEKQFELGMNGVTVDSFNWYSTMDPNARQGEEELRKKLFYQQKDIWNNWRGH